MKEISKLKSLTSLSLIDTQITDLGLMELKELKNLETFSYSDSLITDAGVKALESGLPRL